MINCLLIIAVLLGHYLYVHLLDLNKPSLALLFKMIAAISFVTIGIINLNIPPEKFKIWFVYALFMHALGDILLGIRNILPNAKMFELGAISFLIGHLLFLRGILFEVNKIVCILITAVLLVIYYICYLRKLSITPYKKVFAVVYIFSILLIQTTSINYFYMIKSNTTFIRMIGALLFACSDLILVDYNFRKKNKYKHHIYSFLYFFRTNINRT